MRYLILVAIASGMIVTGCKTASLSKTNGEDRTALLLKWMSGSFDSSDQRKSDNDYFDITLHMYPVWVDQVDGNWLYVEQAVSASPESPYRQRVYKVYRDDEGSYVSKVYELPEPQKFVGKWIGGTEWDALSPEDLIERTGCAVYLKWEEGKFVGSTREKDCKSSLRGADYATSEVSITADRIESWDRGYNEDGEQVWGAEKGPYIFRPATDIMD